MTDNKQPEASELVRRLLDRSKPILDWYGKQHEDRKDGEIMVEAANMIEALASQQPAPKDEPQQQGGGSEWQCDRCTFIAENRREKMAHQAGHNNERVSRPAAVVDDAAVERACAKHYWHAWERWKTQMPKAVEQHRKDMRAALLAAFPEVKI